MVRRLSTVILGTLLLAWASYAPVRSDPAPVASAAIDPRALALLARVQAKLSSIKTLSATCTTTLRVTKTAQSPKAAVLIETIRIRLMRPDFERLDESWTSKSNSGKRISDQKFLTFASSGKTSWRVEGGGSGGVESGPTDPSGRELPLYSAEPLASFFNPQEFVTSALPLLQQEGLLGSVSYLGAVEWNGSTYNVVRVAYQMVTTEIVETNDYYIGADLIIHRIAGSTSDGARQSDYDLSEIRVNAPITRLSFAYTPAASVGITKSVPPLPLIANGATAPDFTVEDADGKPVRLSDYKGDIVVIDFWSTWCGNCVEDMPYTNAIARRYKNKNVVVLAIDVADSVSVFKSWLPKHPEFDALHFAIDPDGIDGKGIDNRLYKGSWLPSEWVIDPSGKIAASFQGYDGQKDVALEGSLKRAGAM